MNCKITGFTDKYIGRFFLPAFLLVLLNTSLIYAADLSAGKAAYLDQDYESAMKIFKPLAVKG